MINDKLYGTCFFCHRENVIVWYDKDGRHMREDVSMFVMNNRNCYRVTCEFCGEEYTLVL